MLFGTGFGGGASNAGTIFQMHSAGSGFTDLYTFTGGADGAMPGGALTLSADGATLYGTTFLGGSSGAGTIISLGIQALPKPATAGMLLLFSSGAIIYRRIRRWKSWRA